MGQALKGLHSKEENNLQESLMSGTGTDGTCQQSVKATYRAEGSWNAHMKIHEAKDAHQKDGRHDELIGCHLAQDCRHAAHACANGQNGSSPLTP